MHFESPTSGEGQQSDGRLTIVLLLIFLFFLWNLGHHGVFTQNTNIHNKSALGINPEKILYINEDEKNTQSIESIPISYYPFFFLPLPINSANKELLMTIKGVGPTLAESIVNHRQNVGPILSIADLQRIPGFGGKRAAYLATELVFENQIEK